MRANLRLALVQLLFALPGCATLPAKLPGPPRPSFPQLAALPPSSQINTICDSTTCGIEWQRAQVWVAKHSRMKIQLATDAVIESYNAETTLHGMYGFRVTREPRSNGRYRLDFLPICAGGYYDALYGVPRDSVVRGNDGHCWPSEEFVVRAFYHYLKTGDDALAGDPNVTWSNSLQYFPAPGGVTRAIEWGIADSTRKRPTMEASPWKYSGQGAPR